MTFCLDTGCGITIDDEHFSLLPFPHAEILSVGDVDDHAFETGRSLCRRQHVSLVIAITIARTIASVEWTCRHDEMVCHSGARLDDQQWPRRTISVPKVVEPGVLDMVCDWQATSCVPT